MKRITGRFEAEIIVKKSRFIAIAQPITGLDDVKGIVKSIWDEHKDATHVVHAAVAGANGSLFSCSDDREPKNTAGRPALEVLKGSGITDIIVCIVRYFGGIKLGTGGLTVAYKTAAREALEAAEHVERTVDDTLVVTVPYTGLNEVMRVVKDMAPAVLEQGYSGMDCRMVLRLRRSLVAGLRARLEKIDFLRVEEV